MSTARQRRSGKTGVTGWPTTPEGWCEWYKIEDVRRDRSVDDPRHHDNRCKLCDPITNII